MTLKEDIDPVDISEYIAHYTDKFPFDVHYDWDCEKCGIKITCDASKAECWLQFMMYSDEEFPGGDN